MQRILIIGSSGAGKSHLALRLGEELGVAVIHLDREYWRPGWSEPAKDEWGAELAHLLQREQWIMDGNFGGTMEMRMEAADTVIFLDMPRTTCVARVLKRWWSYRGEARPDMADGCDEKVDLKFLKWVWRYPVDSKPTVEARLAKFNGRLRVIRLHSSAEIDSFVDSLNN